MPIPLIETPNIPGKAILCTGRKRDGKTFFIYHRIFVPFPGPAVFVDPKGAQTDGLRGEIRRTVEDVKAHPANKIIFQIRPGTSPEKFDEEVAKLFEYLVEWKRGYPAIPMLIVIDEAYRYMSKFEMEEGPNTLIQTVSALNISCVVINPDMSTCPRILFTQSDFIILFSYHPVVKLYLNERLTTEVPEVAWKHLMRNQTDIMSKKGYGIMLDWSDRVWLIYPDGHMDVVEGTKDAEANETDDTSDTEAEGGGKPGPDSPDGGDSAKEHAPPIADSGPGGVKE
jgi:hypothetical protein